MLNIEYKESQRTLKELLSKNHSTYKITYSTDFTNHIVHGLCSIYSIGATSEELKAFYDSYIPELEHLPKPSVDISHSNWTKYFRKRKTYPDYLKFFQSEVNTLGMIPCFKKYIPTLLPGLIASLLHALIHIGYAIEFNLPDVMAEGLAYASSYYLPLGDIIDEVPVGIGYQSISELISECSEFTINHWENGVDAVVKMKSVCGAYKDNLIKILSSWDIKKDSINVQSKLDELTMESIRFYADSSKNNQFDFFLLHQVTANHSVRIILPHLNLEDQVRLLQLNLTSLVLVYLIQGKPNLNSDTILNYTPPSQTNIKTWNDLLPQLISFHKDVHLIKVISNIYQFDCYTKFINTSYYFKLALMTWYSLQGDGDWYPPSVGIGFNQSTKANL